MLIEEIVREGARRMLAEALRAEGRLTSLGSVTSVTRTGAAWWSAMGITSRGRC